MATGWHPCACNMVRVDLSGTIEQIDRALKALPKKYSSMAPDTLEKDEAGWVYVEPAKMCGQETKSVFAPGHDARMAGVAGWAEMVGATLSLMDGGVLRSGDPLTMIEEFGSTALRDKAGIIAMNMEKKPEKKTKAAPATKVRIKVGRWEYDAIIDETTKEASYVSKDGEPITISEGVYKILEEASA